jgi:hypothetical protein
MSMKNKFTVIAKTAVILAAIAVTVLVIVSCKKDVSDPAASRHQLKDECAPSSYIFWAGQNINAGNLVVWNDLTTLYIEYQITDPAQALDELHLWAGKDITQCPQTKHVSPIPGQFPYYANATSSTPAGNPYLTDPMFYHLEIPLTDISATCNDIIYIAAHGKAAVETMWSEGTRFVPPPGNWATYSAYTICCGGGSK